MTKTWHIAAPWPERERMARTWGVTPLMAQILYNRGVQEPSAVRAFLSPQLSDLEEPSTLPGVDAAAGVIAAAVRDGRRIVIYGDYDVDGITGSAILWHVLRLAGVSADLYVPHRIDEGYGINVEALERLRHEGAELVISVDCGITAVEAAERARAVGLELIITDHHQPGPTLPSCRAIVHPTALGASPNPHLCGAGVAFKLAWRIAQTLSSSPKVAPEFREYLLNATGLAALGTIADVVPLVGENRIIAHYGLAGLPSSTLVGVQALIDSAGLSGETIDSYAVGFKLAPRLNAAGRMGHARLALELLTRADATRAEEIARYLEQHNKARQSLERKIVQQACEQVEASGQDSDAHRVIVLAAEGWHAGVIGIVAARLVDRYHRPAVMIALNGAEGQGSARSIAHFELHQALAACNTHLISHGGHSMAAGLRIAPDAVAAFRAALNEYAIRRLTPADLIPRLPIDAEVGLQELDLPTVHRLLALGPFGCDNPRPRLATRWLRVVGQPRCVGKGEEHLQLTVEDGATTRKAIAFRMAEHAQALRDERVCRLAFRPIINEFRGQQNVELQVDDLEVGRGADHGHAAAAPAVDLDTLPF